MKKVLIITYYWPPSGGSGVQRWLKFSKYLPKYGWKPIIYTPQNTDFKLKYGAQAPQNDEIEVLTTPIFDPGALFAKSSGKMKIGEVVAKSASLITKLAIWIRGNYFIPDSKIFWVTKSVRYLVRYLKDHPVDVIVTTGPPHSMHLIGLGLKDILGVQWVADFRDPWSEGDILNQLSVSPKTKKQHEKLESQVLSKADIVLSVGQRMADRFKSRVPDGAYKVITNGYDPEDFEKEIARKASKFVITYSGLLYNNRNPRAFWQVLDELIKSNQSLAEVIEVKIIGLIDPAVETELKQYSSLINKIVQLGYLSHQDSIEALRKSNALLLTVDNTENSLMLIPGKLFEYLATDLPIIGFGNADSDANQILIASGHEPLMEYSDKEEIKLRINTLFEQFQSGEMSREFSHQSYSRVELTNNLVELLDDLNS